MAETTFFWEPLSDNILQERDEAGTVAAEYTTERHIYGNLISQTRNGGESRYHFDALGTTLALTDDDRQVTDTFAYSAFGELTEQAGSTESTYQYFGQRGYYRDSLTGNYFVRARAYDPERATWRSPDPLGVHSTVNQYIYARQRPLTYGDPSGQKEIANDQDRCSCEEFKSTLGGPITITPDPFFKTPQFGVCSIDVECRDDCDGFPAKTYPPTDAGLITICLSTKGQHRMTFKILYQHEYEHAQQLCGGADISTCTGCVNWETKAHKINCKLAFPKDASRQTDCVKCGVYLSCKAKCEGKPNAPPKPVKHCDSWGDLGVILPDFPFPDD